MTDLMEVIGAQGSIAEFYTFDDYIFPIPMKDFTKYDVILACKISNKFLKITNFCPYFIIYPRDDCQEDLMIPIME